MSVNMMSDHTTIKTKFSLGPLVLKVEKEFGRAAKKELRSATATTAEMSGKLSLRVLHGGAATLHSIRVLQPKQVRQLLKMLKRREVGVKSQGNRHYSSTWELERSEMNTEMNLKNWKHRI